MFFLLVIVFITITFIETYFLTLFHFYPSAFVGHLDKPQGDLKLITKKYDNDFIQNYSKNQLYTYLDFGIPNVKSVIFFSDFYSILKKLNNSSKTFSVKYFTNIIILCIPFFSWFFFFLTLNFIVFNYYVIYIDIS